MPDVGAPLSSRPTHTSTQEWQSFEIRMRRRRAERCLLRAEIALDAGFENDARAALDEARRLDWQSPDFDSLKARIDQRRAAEAAQRNGRRRVAYLAAAALAVAAAGTAFFVSDQTDAPRATPAANLTVPSTVTAPALPISEPPTSPADAASAPPEPQPARVADPETRRSDPEPNRPERPLSARADMTAGLLPSEPAVRQAAAQVRELPQIAVPTTSLPVQQSVPDATGMIGRSSIGSLSPPPVAETRVPDLPPAPPVTPLPAPRAEPPPAPDDSGVRAALARYESAYSSLNASAAHAVYPGVDEQSLERAFESLESQRVSLGSCTISMNGARAQATCQGRSTWTPKVGSGTQSSARTWRFDLANAGGSWQITRADAR